MTAAARGAEELVRRAFAEGRVDGVLGIGGGAGTTIGTRAMRALPIGVPKLMVSTLASGQVAHLVERASTGGVAVCRASRLEARVQKGQTTW